MHWSAIPIHVIDFEGSRRSGILEVGVVTVSGGKVAETWTRLCRPIGHIPARDREVHGIDRNTAGREPLFDCEWERFVALRRNGIFGAHGAGTENHLLKSVWPYGEAAPDFAERGGRSNEWGPWIDTARLYGSIFPGLATLELQELVTVFSCGEKLNDLAKQHCPSERCRFHAALYDALASAVLLLDLLDRPGFEKTTLQWLLQMSRGAGRRQELAQRQLFSDSL